MFADAATLLQHTNATRLLQLAVPADRAMVDESALRAAIAGDDLSGYSAADQATLVLVQGAIHEALADASGLIVNYGIPEDFSSGVVARLATTIALYYLQRLGGDSEAATRAYEGAIATLKSHSKGELNLVPVVADPPQVLTDGIEIVSGQSRYRDWPTEDDRWC
jgi:phage gp36-like protein